LDLNDFAGAELYCVTGGHSIGSTSSNITKEAPKLANTTISLKPKRLEEKELPRLPQMTAEETQERRDLCLLLLKMYLNISDKYVMLTCLLNAKWRSIKAIFILTIFPGK
jgi:hypothetical protein